MRKSFWLSTSLGAALLATGPVLAQSVGHQPPSDPVAPLHQQQQAARQVDRTGQSETMDLLRQSEQAAAAGNWARANEYLERAETSWLNYQAMSGGSPRGSAYFQQADQAIKNRDRSEAQDALQSVMAEVSRDSSATMATGSGVAPMPMQGGGMMMGTTPTQAQPQGGLGTPGGASPYGATGGTQTMPSPLQPGTSATGNVQGQMAGPRGAPPAGQPLPQAGDQSSNLSTGGQIQPGSPTAGGGTSGSSTASGGR